MAETTQPVAPAWFDPTALVDLIDELRVAGFNIDLTHYMAAQDLLLALAARGATLDSPQRLQGLLGPLLCSSPAEQAEFPHHFERWAARLVYVTDVKPILAATTPLPAVPTSDLEEELVTIDRQARWGRWVLRGIYVLLFSILLQSAHLPMPRREPIITPATPIVSTPITLVAPTPAADNIAVTPVPTQIAPITPLPDQIAPVLPPAPTRFEQVMRGLWHWQTLAAILLLLMPLLAWRLWWFYRAHQFLARRATTQTPELEKVVVQSSASTLFSPLALFRLAQGLRRRVEIPSYELDIEAALRATIQHAGWFTPVYGRRRVVPEYLILVDRAHYHDHQARLVEELGQRLRAYEVLITLYAFDGDPRICFPLAGKGAPLTLRDLAAKHPDQRLILFADANSFFSPFTGALEPWVAQLARWSERALLTPEVATNWGYREQELAEQFGVLPATPAGLAQLVQSFTQPILAIAADELPQARLPEVLRTRPLRWLERQPPEPALVEMLMADLRTYLDEAGFIWLCACAVYPTIDWNLTLYLGHTLQTDEKFPYLESGRLLTIARLPWLRYGYMPDWLRGQLLKSLPRPQERAVRFALQTLLLTAVQGTSVGFPLEIARRHQRNLSRLARPLLSLIVRNADEDSSLQDYVFLNFMIGRKSRSLAFHLPEHLFALIVHQQDRFVKLSSTTKRASQLSISWIASLVNNSRLERRWPSALAVSVIVVVTAIGLALVCYTTDSALERSAVRLFADMFAPTPKSEIALPTLVSLPIALVHTATQTTDATATTDQTATAMAANPRGTPTRNLTAIKVALTATQTIASQSMATAFAATLTAQPTSAATEMETTIVTILAVNPTKTPTPDETATAALIIIKTALAAAKTVESQGSATDAEATRLAQPTATLTPDIGATETKAAQSMATSVAATLTAQPTASPSHTPTPNLTATAVVIEGGIATSVAATLAAQPTATPPPQPTPTTLIRPPDDNPGTLRIAFVYGDVGDSDLRVANVETGSERIIAGQACDEAEPAWSPNGAQLVYHADCAESYDIYRVNSDGSASTRLTFTGDIDEREPAYSPDGNQIIFRVNPREARETNAVGELWVMDVNGNSQHALGFIGRAPAWSPDGSRIAFMSDRSGRWNIYLYEVGTGRTDQLTSCDTNCRWPAWSSDGQALVYNTTTKPTNTEAEAIWIISARGGNATRIAVGRNPGRASWSGTGLIAFNSTDGIEYMREDGSERALLLPGDVNWAPHWSK